MSSTAAEVELEVTPSDVYAAAERLASVNLIHRTPLLESLALNNRTGARILVKAENLQVAGSFKIRGALNALLCLPTAQRRAGVIAFSSGNFGQGLAAAAGMLGVPCTIVMPGDAPANKEQRARSYGSDVVRAEIIDGVNREVTAAALAAKLAEEGGLTLLHPFEHPNVIAGQGSCGLEIVQQCKEKGIQAVDAVLICAGGGGLAAGCCLAISDLMPTAELYVVEPEGYDDHVLSLAKGERISLTSNPPSTMDSLQAVAPGENTFPINKRLLAGALAVTDDEVAAAMQIAFETLQVGIRMPPKHPFTRRRP